MKQYKLIEEQSLTVFNEAVTRHLNRGWRLYGDPFALFAPGTKEDQFCQAVVSERTPGAMEL